MVRPKEPGVRIRRDCLSPGQEAFSREFVRNGHRASEAYRATRDCSRMGLRTITSNAYTLSRHPKVVKRVKELEEKATAIASADLAITIEGQSQKLEAIFTKAVKAKHWTAAIAAVEAQNKIHGLMTKERDNDRASTLKERLEQVRADRKARLKEAEAEASENVVKLPRRA